MVYYLVASYASSLGGIGTIVGSGTNLTLKGFLEKYVHIANFAKHIIFTVIVARYFKTFMCAEELYDIQYMYNMHIYI